MASDVMLRELILLAKKKPLVVSMGSVAASGGYYVAMASQNVFALPLTVTGSIGVFYGKADGSELLRKIGVGIDTVKTAPRADAESLVRPFTEDERIELQRKVGQFYDGFIERVSVGRKLSKQEVDKVAQGRVWLGQQAIERKLVDKMGGLRHALDEARRLGSLPSDAPILEVPGAERSLIQKAIGLFGGMGEDPIRLPKDLRVVARGLAPLMVHDTPGALARMEWIDADDSDDVEELRE